MILKPYYPTRVQKSALLIFAICLSLSILLIPSTCQAKRKKPKWKKEISTLRCGQQFRYRIKRKPAKAKIRYYSNHRSLASIQKKTGLLRAKKKGVVRITAKITTSKKRVTKLTTRVKILPKASAKSSDSKKKTSAIPSDSDHLLDPSMLHLSDSINPWNHSLLLYSDRILLTSEVEDSTLTLSQADSQNNTTVAAGTSPADTDEKTELTAHFASLSEDGKTVSYRLSDEAAQKLCPGNGSRDGIYTVKSPLFSGALATCYQETIQPNSICGFVTTDDGTALSQVTLTLTRDSASDSVSVCTDETGYYCFKNITPGESQTLTARRSSYDLYSRTVSSQETMTCQNIVMHPASVRDLALVCQVRDAQNQIVSPASVLITDAKQAPIAGGTVNEDGQITFASHAIHSLTQYTQIDYQNGTSTPSFHTGKRAVPTPDSADETPQFIRNQSYRLYVFPGTNDTGTSPPREYAPVSFEFDFTSILSDALVLQIRLQQLPTIAVEKLSIQTDQLSRDCARLEYTLYDSKGYTLYDASLSVPEQSTSASSAQEMSPSSVQETSPAPAQCTSPARNCAIDCTSLLNACMQKDSLRLCDETYYFGITAYSSTNDLIGTTEILPAAIRDGVFASASCSLAPANTYQVLLYLKCAADTRPLPAFTLYQKSDTSWFPIHTYATDTLYPLSSSTAKAYLSLTGLLPDTTYRLVSRQDCYIISSGSVFRTPASMRQNATAQTPEHQVILSLAADVKTAANADANVDTTSGTAQASASEYPLMEYRELCTETHCLDSAFYASASSYPNTVYAYYQSDGTFQNIVLATPAFLSFPFGSASSSAVTPAAICNRLQNGATITTSLTTYRSTPFFVT